MICFGERCYSNQYDEISDDEFSDDEISGDEISASRSQDHVPKRIISY